MKKLHNVKNNANYAFLFLAIYYIWSEETKEMSTQIEKSIIYINEGKKALGQNDRKTAFRLLCDGFYLRVHKEFDIDLEFYQFFMYQFARYLVGKKRFTVSLPEGDMIADLILETYQSFQESIEDSPFNLESEGIWNLLKGIRIDFPCQNDTKLLSL